MSKYEKALAKMRATPTPSDFKWDDMVMVLKNLGYELLTGRGSRRKFYHRDKDLVISCHEPHPRSEVDKGCLVDVIDHLETNGLI